MSEPIKITMVIELLPPWRCRGRRTIVIEAEQGECVRRLKILRDHIDNAIVAAEVAAPQDALCRDIGKALEELEL